MVAEVSESTVFDRRRPAWMARRVVKQCGEGQADQPVASRFAVVAEFLLAGACQMY